MTMSISKAARLNLMGKGGNMEDMTEKEMQSVKMSTLYELRLIFTQGEKNEYTTNEIVEILDKIAMAKEQ